MTRRRIAVVGAGWAGLAGAVAATQAGWSVTLFEAARQAGGRARSLPVTLQDASAATLDNGQHVLLGACTATLEVMRTVGVHPVDALQALPLSLLDARGHGVALPDWPAPLDVAWAFLRARGWRWAERAALLAHAVRWRGAGYTCPAGTSVRQLARSLPARAIDEFIDPLCVAAMNTPPEHADAAVFLRLLRDALTGPGWGTWRASTLLLPRLPLGELLPQPALRWLRAQAADVRLGARVQAIERDRAHWRVDGDTHDAVLLALPATEAARLVQDCGASPGWARDAAALAHQTIATVYVHGAAPLPRPMLALRGGPAQFAFDRGQLGGPAGVLALVASAAPGDRERLQHEALHQARAALANPRLEVLQTVVERRATFACTPGLRRPTMRIAPSLWACGDYVEGPYPATLEGAVRSGQAAANAITADAITADAITPDAITSAARRVR